MRSLLNPQFTGFDFSIGIICHFSKIKPFRKSSAIESSRNRAKGFLHIQPYNLVGYCKVPLLFVFV
jgi:hypothetical protein